MSSTQETNDITNDTTNNMVEGKEGEQGKEGDKGKEGEKGKGETEEIIQIGHQDELSSDSDSDSDSNSNSGSNSDDESDSYLSEESIGSTKESTKEPTKSTNGHPKYNNFGEESEEEDDECDDFDNQKERLKQEAKIAYRLKQQDQREKHTQYGQQVQRNKGSMRNNERSNDRNNEKRPDRPLKFCDPSEGEKRLASLPTEIKDILSLIDPLITLSFVIAVLPEIIKDFIAQKKIALTKNRTFDARFIQFAIVWHKNLRQALYKLRSRCFGKYDLDLPQNDMTIALRKFIRNQYAEDTLQNLIDIAQQKGLTLVYASLVECYRKINGAVPIKNKKTNTFHEKKFIKKNYDSQLLDGNESQEEKFTVNRQQRSQYQHKRGQNQQNDQQNNQRVYRRKDQNGNQQNDQQHGNQQHGNQRSIHYQGKSNAKSKIESTKLGTKSKFETEFIRPEIKFTKPETKAKIRSKATPTYTRRASSSDLPTKASK